MKQTISADSIIGKRVIYLDYLGSRTNGTIVSFTNGPDLEPGEVYVYIRNDDYEDLNTNEVDGPNGPLLDKSNNMIMFDMIRKSTQISISI